MGPIFVNMNQHESHDPELASGGESRFCNVLRQLRRLPGPGLADHDQNLQ